MRPRSVWCANRNARPTGVARDQAAAETEKLSGSVVGSVRSVQVRPPVDAERQAQADRERSNQLVGERTRERVPVQGLVLKRAVPGDHHGQKGDRGQPRQRPVYEQDRHPTAVDADGHRHRGPLDAGCCHRAVRGQRDQPSRWRSRKSSTGGSTRSGPSTSNSPVSTRQ